MGCSVHSGSTSHLFGPGGVFVPPPSANAPGPCVAPPPSGAAPGGSSGPAPQFPFAPPGTPRDSESEDSDSGSSSASAALDSSATQLAELVYEFCLEARPVFDSAPPPRCGFEAWFDPLPASSSARYRVYPRVAAVESEVADRVAALHCHSKPLSAVLPRKIRRYAVVDQPHFAAPQPVNPSFSRLAGASAVGSKRWGSVTFAEMERLERLFRSQLKVTSSSLRMLSRILTMLKRDGFNPSTPGLLNTVITSVSALLALQARSAASGSVFLRAKRWESLLAHSKVPIPEPQKRALVVSPGSDSDLFAVSLSSTRLRTRLRRTRWFPPPWRFPRLCPRVRGRSLSPRFLLLSPVRRVFVLVRHSGLSILRCRLALVTASASKGVRGRLLLRNLRVFASRSRPLP